MGMDDFEGFKQARPERNNETMFTFDGTGYNSAAMSALRGSTTYPVGMNSQTTAQQEPEKKKGFFSKLGGAVKNVFK